MSGEVAVLSVESLAVRYGARGHDRSCPRSLLAACTTSNGRQENVPAGPPQRTRR